MLPWKSRVVPSSWLGPAALREMYVAAFREYGSLYDFHRDPVEQQCIRDECEAIGVPMGYGRVGTAPHVLGDEYLPGNHYDADNFYRQP